MAVFPAIRELDICSNPLITQRTTGALSFSFSSWPVSSVTSLMSPAGDPPSLTQYLQHRLGITVKSNSQPKVSPVSRHPPEFSKPQMVLFQGRTFSFNFLPLSRSRCRTVLVILSLTGVIHPSGEKQKQGPIEGETRHQNTRDVFFSPRSDGR